jgi:hypothetical protein
MAKHRKQLAVSAKAKAKAAERKGRARERSMSFVADEFEEFTEFAIQCISDMLRQLHKCWPGLMCHVYGDGHRQFATEGFEQLKFCLGLPGRSAVISGAHALNAVWTQALVCGCTLQQYCVDAGLSNQFKHCLRTFQDAIAMGMILDPDAFQEMNELPIAVNTRSRLRQSYFMMQRYLRDVGQHLLEMVAECDSGGTGK